MRRCSLFKEQIGGCSEPNPHSAILQELLPYAKSVWVIARQRSVTAVRRCYS